MLYLFRFLLCYVMLYVCQDCVYQLWKHLSGVAEKGIKNRLFANILDKEYAICQHSPMCFVMFMFIWYVCFDLCFAVLCFFVFMFPSVSVYGFVMFMFVCFVFLFCYVYVLLCFWFVTFMVCYVYALCLYFVVYMFCYDFPVAEKGIKNRLFANILENSYTPTFSKM